MASANTTEDHTTWTPEQLMRSYHGSLKQDLFIRCAEWYTNPEVEAKINSGRTDGSKIKNPNFYAEFKRNVDNAAIRDGHLPAEYRLQFDKRRLLNSVTLMVWSVLVWSVTNPIWSIWSASANLVVNLVKSPDLRWSPRSPPSA